MNNTSVSLYRQVLGTQWDDLAPVIQRHYDLKDGETLQAEGALNLHHSTLLTPMLHVTGWFGLLFPEQGSEVRTTLTNEAGVDANGNLYVAWGRRLHFKTPDGAERLRRFDSVVTLLARGDETLALERVALKQAVALRMSAGADGALVYESDGFYAVPGSWRIPMPTPVRLVIREWPHPTEPDAFRMEFHMTAPLLGSAFGYEGEFRIVNAGVSLPTE